MKNFNKFAIALVATTIYLSSNETMDNTRNIKESNTKENDEINSNIIVLSLVGLLFILIVLLIIKRKKQE